jgi:segregation and condensation protein A
MAIDVSTPVYEGPFDLLLQLILQEKVDIYEVDLSIIVDRYLAELEHIQRLDLDVATEFLLIAATLVELKTRRLLPGADDGDLDEEFALWEERDLLLARLIECKTFKDVAQVFSRLADEADLSFPRLVGPDERFAGLLPDLLEGTSVRRLQSAAIRALTPKPEPFVDLFHVNPIRFTVAEAVAELIDDLPRVGRISFRRLTADLVDRLEVIVRFLAVLELYKQGVVDLDQTERFGDI